MDLLSNLASAIATEEGFFAHEQSPNLPQRNHNPGDLRAAPWLVHPVIANNFWKAESAEQGIAGLYHQLALDIARGWSLEQLITSWAPATDHNRTDQYLRNIAAMTGLPRDVPLWRYLELRPARTAAVPSTAA